MDLAIGFALGVMALPWMWLSLVVGLCILDIVLCETEQFGWATTCILVGGVLVSYFGAGVNPGPWIWANLADIALYLLAYFAIGAVWSIVKWYFHLVGVRKEWKRNIDAWDKRQGKLKEGETNRSGGHRPTRPVESYAENSKGRIMGWIGHWPFSMVGVLLGDFLRKIVESIYDVLSGLYTRIEKSVLGDLEKP